VNSVRTWIGAACRVGLSLLGGACGGSEFLCESNAQCVAEMGAGMCQSSGYCSFTDAECPSGQRYGEHAPGELANQCVPTIGDPSSDDGDSGLPPGSDGTSSGETLPVADSSSEGSSSDSGPPPGESSSGTDAESTDGDSSTGPAPSACDEQYAVLPDYMLCMETPTACHVYTTHDVSCTDHCHAQGGECSQAFDNVMGRGCTVAAAITCDTTDGGHAICVCSKGCGSGPACVSPQVCTAGTCA
jgi:hypothetical protein